MILVFALYENCEMVPLKLESRADPKPADPLSPEASAYLNHLRFVSMACRSKPRADLFEACALLQVSRPASQEAHAEALVRCLGEALGKTAKFHSPGTQEMTFDETWLLQLGLACVRQDEASVSFLLASRVGREHRRLVRFLVARISGCFSLA